MLFHLEDIFLEKAIIEMEKESLILVDMFNMHSGRMSIRRIWLGRLCTLISEIPVCGGNWYVSVLGVLIVPGT